MLMTDSATNSDEGKRHSAFKRGDVLIFIVFPIVLILGFLLFQWLRKTYADPNLRLVAHVTDDISVELVAVTQHTGQSTSYTKWWKPNGLPAKGIVEEAPGIALGKTMPDTRLFLFGVSERRPSVEPALSGLILTGNTVGTDRSSDGKTAIVVATIAPTMFSTSSCGLKVASLGRQNVGVLTPEKPSFDSTVHGQFAVIEIGKTVDLVPEERRNPRSIWAVKITEEASDQNRTSSWRIEARDKTGRWMEKESVYHSSPGPICDYWQLEGDDWATVTVERTVYDKEVVFVGVSAFEGSLASPRVDYVGPVRSK
jgi:hypothetical protein